MNINFKILFIGDSDMMRYLRHYLEGCEYCDLNVWDGVNSLSKNLIQNQFDLIILDNEEYYNQKDDLLKLMDRAKDIVCLTSPKTEKGLMHPQRHTIHYLVADPKEDKNLTLDIFNRYIYQNNNYLFIRLNLLVQKISRKSISLQEVEMHLGDFLRFIPFATHCAFLWKHNSTNQWFISHEVLRKDVVLREFFIQNAENPEFNIFYKSTLLNIIDIPGVGYQKHLPENVVCLPVEVSDGLGVLYLWGYEHSKEIAAIHILVVQFLAYFLKGVIDHQILKTKENLLQEKFNQAEKVKVAFLNNISHEIRTPLNGILGLSELICDESIPNLEKKDFVNQIKKNSRNLLLVINDLIDLSQIEAGEIRVKRVKKNLIEVVKEFYESNCKEFSNEDIEFLLDIDIHQKVSAMIEPRLFWRLLEIILGNAYKFTNKGTITLGCRLKKKTVEIYVKDTGEGIAPEFFPNLFKRFWQGDASLTRPRGGNGLGLYMAKKIVDLLDGTIDLKSKVGQGSEFIIIFPKIMGETKGFPDWNDKKILIAEDNEANFVFLQTVLKRTGMSIIWATDGNEAIDLFDKNPDVDLILMDVYMPEMNGTDATKIIREKTEIPIIAQTAYSDDDDKSKLGSYGFSHFIFKPIRPNGLIEMLSKIFQGAD